VEVEDVVERAHAGPCSAKYEKMVPRGGQLVKVVESYGCLVCRDSETAGGSKGSIVGMVDVDVDDWAQAEASASFKMIAPKEPGTYELRVHMRSGSTLGVRADVGCSFEVVAAESLAAQQKDEDSYSD